MGKDACYIQTLGTVKRGDTFVFYARFKGKDGSVSDIDVESLKSEVRNEAGMLYAELDVAEHPTEEGTFLFSADTEVTEKWPVDTVLYIDIQIQERGITTSTETFAINVVKDVTSNG